MATASAVSTGMVTITCAKPDGTQRTSQVGWDNSNQFFAGKGDIARLYCEGGYAGEYRTFISTSVSDLSLRYYQGVVPNQDTQTSTSETQTVVAESETVTVVAVPDSSPAVSDTPTQSLVGDTSSAVLETQTVSDSLTATIDTSTQIVDSSTSSVDTDTSTTETSTATLPQEPVEISPLPTPPPAVEPQPVPVVQEPQPQPQPQPEPQPSPVVTDVVVPSEEQPSEEQPVVEEPQPVEEPSVPPVVEETNESPVEEPVIQEQPEPTPEPEPEPSVEPEPTSLPDTAPEPPIVEPSVPQVVELGSVDLSTLAPDTPVQLDNGVVLTAEVVIALQLLENPAELLGQLFTDPGQVLTAISNIGADMSPEVREKSEKIVVSAIIAGGIATQAAGLAASATYRRNQ